MAFGNETQVSPQQCYQFIFSGIPLLFHYIFFTYPVISQRWNEIEISIEGCQCNLREELEFKLWACLNMHRNLSCIILQIFCQSLLETRARSVGSFTHFLSPYMWGFLRQGLCAACSGISRSGQLQALASRTQGRGQPTRNNLGLRTNLKS